MTTQTIDVHAHILTEETIRLLQREAPKVAPKLSEVDEQFGTLDVAGSVYRHFPRGGWDLERRLAGHGGLQGRRAGAVGLSADLHLRSAAGAGGGVSRASRTNSSPSWSRRIPGASSPSPRCRCRTPKLAADELRHAMRRLGLARRADRLEHRRQESRRSGTRAGLGHGVGARRLHPGASHQRGGHGPARLVLPEQSDRQSARYHHRGRLPGVQRRARALSEPEVLPVPWRRLRALPGRALRARLACARRAEEASCAKPPTAIRSKRFYFDTIMHSKDVLEFLVGNAGVRSRAARQRLSVRHGHAGRRAAGRRTCRSRRRQGIHPGRAGPALAGRGGTGKQRRAPSARNNDEASDGPAQRRPNKDVEEPMAGPAEAARTPGAKRAGDGRIRVRPRARSITSSAVPTIRPPTAPASKATA